MKNSFGLWENLLTIVIVRGATLPDIHGCALGRWNEKLSKFEMFDQRMARL